MATCKGGVRHVSRARLTRKRSTTQKKTLIRPIHAIYRHHLSRQNKAAQRTHARASRAATRNALHRAQEAEAQGILLNASSSTFTIPHSTVRRIWTRRAPRARVARSTLTNAQAREILKKHGVDLDRLRKKPSKKQDNNNAKVNALLQEYAEKKKAHAALNDELSAMMAGIHMNTHNESNELVAAMKHFGL